MTYKLKDVMKIFVAVSFVFFGLSSLCAMEAPGLHAELITLKSNLVLLKNKLEYGLGKKLGALEQKISVKKDPPARIIGFYSDKLKVDVEAHGGALSWSGVVDLLENKDASGTPQYGSAFFEGSHSFIQWLFPTYDVGVNADADLLTLQKVREFVKDPELIKRLVKSFEIVVGGYYKLKIDVTKGAYRYLDQVTVSIDDKKFGQTVSAMTINGSHNCLRITRIQDSLKSFGLTNYAKAFFECLKVIDSKYKMGNSFSYWAKVFENEYQDSNSNLMVEILGSWILNESPRFYVEVFRDQRNFLVGKIFYGGDHGDEVAGIIIYENSPREIVNKWFAVGGESYVATLSYIATLEYFNIQNEPDNWWNQRYYFIAKNNAQHIEKDELTIGNTIGFFNFKKFTLEAIEAMIVTADEVEAQKVIDVIKKNPIQSPTFMAFNQQVCDDRPFHEDLEQVLRAFWDVLQPLNSGKQVEGLKKRKIILRKKN